MRLIGLTGSIGSGKSTVSRLLRARGIPVLEADEVAREVSDDPRVLEDVRQELGPGLVIDGRLDRAAVASLVFADPAARARLNAIVHPRVRAEMARRTAQLAQAGAPTVVQDIPLLFESGLESMFDAILVVDAPLELRVRRVVERVGLDEPAVRARDAAQMPAHEKRRRATVVLDNDGTIDDLDSQLQSALEIIGRKERDPPH